MAFGTLKGKCVTLYNLGKNTRGFLYSIQTIQRKKLWNDSKLLSSAAYKRRSLKIIQTESAKLYLGVNLNSQGVLMSYT